MRDHIGRSALSAITRAEVISGASCEDEEATLRGLLDRFPTLPVDAPVADLAGRLRRRHGWKLPDALQAAVARYHGLRLATRDRDDFPPERFDWVEVPYEL